MRGGGPTTKLFPFFDSPCLWINLFMEGKILFCIKDKQNNNNNNNSWQVRHITIRYFFFLEWDPTPIKNWV